MAWGELGRSSTRTGFGVCSCRRVFLPSEIEAGGCVPARLSGRSEMLLTTMIITEY